MAVVSAALDEAFLVGGVAMRIEQVGLLAVPRHAFTPEITDVRGESG